ncbi:hypothetical protein ABFX02_08G064900 [Erythranthe guttata]
MEKKSAAAVVLTEEEQAESVFNMFDKNGDGKISRTELGAILSSLGSSTSAADAARLMSELDKDGDGFIDRSEFRAYKLGGAGGDGEELKEAFALYDKDKNGKISATELHSVLTSLGTKCSVKDCRKMIASFDVDGDGCMNFDEFKKMMTRTS